MKYWNLLIVVGLSFSIISCSDSLDIEETDSIITESGEFEGVASVSGSLDGLYNGLRGDLDDQNNLYALNEVTTEELLVPTRGTDWGDNGIWRTLHAHTWTPNHQYILNVWNQYNGRAFSASQIIADVSTADREDDLIAEAKFLRAHSYWVLLDAFGQVPYRGVFDGPSELPVVMTAQQVYDSIITDLDDAIAGLAAAPAGGSTRATSTAANFLKAKVLLNANIYLGGTPSAANMQEVISLVNSIEADGFSIHDDYFEIFEGSDVSTDSETIWYFSDADVGARIWNTLHYNQTSPGNTGGGWNGFSTLAEFYETFEAPDGLDGNPSGGGQEERRGFVPTLAESSDANLGIGYGFLIGQQSAVTGYDDDENPQGYEEKNDRAGTPLVFTAELPGLIGNNERTGIRVIKYHPVDGARNRDLIVFRYSDAHLMRAEARFRDGDQATALDDLNTLRALRDASALTAIDEATILAERGRELYAEGWRRNDMIRFGQFTRDWQFKNGDAIGIADRNLFPIPTSAILSNPNLEQNPGY